MAGARRPPLYRASRYFSIAATLVAVLIVVYVAAGIYSVSMLRPGNTGGTSLEQNVTDGGFELTAVVNFSNPGFFPIDQVHLSTVVDDPNGTGTLAVGSSPDVRIGAGSVGQVPLTIVIPFASGSHGAYLITHDAKLPTTIFANVSFAQLYSVAVELPMNLSWGAPLENLSITPGTPTEANGSVSLPLTIYFADQAPYPVDGTLDLLVEGQGGSDCDVPVTTAVDTAAQTSETYPVTVTAPSGCSFPSGTPVTGTFSSASWSVDLPTEALP
jgi:hypothetical protein